MEMNKNFPEWYRIASIELRDEQIKARWDGIELFCQNEVSLEMILNLICLFNNFSCSSDFHEKFISPFFEIDAAFPQKNNLELSVLAGAVLIYLIENDHTHKNAILLSLIIASMYNSNIPVIDIVDTVKIEFDKSRQNIRKKYNIEKLIYNQQKKLFDTLTNAKTSNSLNFQEFGDSMLQYLKSLESHIDIYRKSNLIYYEDSQILWWMNGEWSRDFQKPFKEINKLELCIVVGKELADMVELLPGPFAAEAVLNKVLSSPSNTKDKEISLMDVIDSTDKKWRQDTLDSYPNSKTKALTPLLTALSESLKVENAGEWKFTFKGQTGLDVDKIKITALKIAYQMFLECLLIKSLEK